MIDVRDIKDRLSAQLVPATLASVGGTADLIAALDQLRADASAFVMSAANRAGANTAGTVMVRQKVDQQVSIVIGFLGADATGDNKIDDTQTVENALIECLVGWQPPGAQSPFEYRGGKVVTFDPEQSALFWGSDFVCSAYLRKTQT